MKHFCRVHNQLQNQNPFSNHFPSTYYFYSQNQTFKAYMLRMSKLLPSISVHFNTPSFYHTWSLSHFSLSKSIKLYHVNRHARKARLSRNAMRLLRCKYLTATCTTGVTLKSSSYRRVYHRWYILIFQPFWKYSNYEFHRRLNEKMSN